MQHCTLAHRTSLRIFECAMRLPVLRLHRWYTFGSSSRFSNPLLSYASRFNQSTIASWGQFDKAALVAAHETILPSLSHHIPDLPLEDPQTCHDDDETLNWKGELKPILLSEMDVERKHTGRKLCGVLCVEPIKLGRLVATVLEGDDGKGIRMLIKHAVLWSSSDDEVHNLFPQGIRIAVKHPFIGESCLGGLALWVRTPASLETITNFPTMQPIFQTWEAKQLRDEGNKYFSLQKLALAIELYSMSIQAGNNNNDFVLSYSDRAEAWLELGHFEKALRDAEQALRVEPDFVKALYCKGLAMHGLQQYRDACTCLEAAILLSGENNQIKRALDKSILFNMQSQCGQNDLSDYVLSGCKKEKVPECGDFVGPVRIGMTHDGRGRGLFLTEDAKMGDLLLVSNALGFIDNDGVNMDLRSDAITMVVKRCIASPRILRQVYSLADSETQTSREIPDVDMFRPNSSWMGYQQAETEQPIDLDRIRAILSRNAFSHSLSPNISAESQAQYIGLWILPSFLNHSCLPVVSLLTVGRTMFIHAARDLSAGEELTFSYIESLMPWSVYRKDLCYDGWGFFCHCKRCNLEESLASCFQKIDDRFRDLMSDDRDPNNTFLEMAELAVEIERQLNSLVQLTVEEKQWIRAAYFSAYGTQIGEESLARTVTETEMPTTEKIMEALLVSAPGHLKTTALMPQLAVKCQLESRMKGQELLLDSCIAAFGRHEMHVIQSIILKLWEKGMEALLPE